MRNNWAVLLIFYTDVAYSLQSIIYYSDRSTPDDRHTLCTICNTTKCLGLQNKDI
jgi:hypothetical protein